MIILKGLEGQKIKIRAIVKDFGIKKGWKDKEIEMITFENLLDSKGNILKSETEMNFTKRFSSLRLKKGDFLTFFAFVRFDKKLNEYKFTNPSQINILQRTKQQKLFDLPKTKKKTPIKDKLGWSKERWEEEKQKAKSELKKIKEIEKSIEKKEEKVEIKQEIKIENDMEIESEAKQEIEIENDTEIESEAKQEIEIENDTEIESEAKQEIEIENDTEIESEAKQEIEIENDTEIESEAKQEIEIENDTEIESEINKEKTIVEEKKDNVNFLEDIYDLEYIIDNYDKINEKVKALVILYFNNPDKILSLYEQVKKELVFKDFCTLDRFLIQLYNLKNSIEDNEIEFYKIKMILIKLAEKK